MENNEQQTRAEQLHDAVIAALRELAQMRPASTAGYQAALSALGERI